MKTLFDQDITLDEAEKLIKNGADVNERAKDGATPLFYIKNIEVAKLLIENGANVNASDRLGYTPLFTDNIDIIILLVNNGDDINHRNAFHVTTFNVNSNNQKKIF